MSGPFYIVEVDEQRDERLAGQAGCGYVSPPQPLDQAVALVRVLLGGDRDLSNPVGAVWRLPVAGGQRIIHLRRA